MSCWSCCSVLYCSHAVGVDTRTDCVGAAQHSADREQQHPAHQARHRQRSAARRPRTTHVCVYHSFHCHPPVTLTTTNASCCSIRHFSTGFARSIQLPSPYFWELLARFDERMDTYAEQIRLLEQILRPPRAPLATGVGGGAGATATMSDLLADGRRLTPELLKRLLVAQNQAFTALAGGQVAEVHNTVRGGSVVQCGSWSLHPHGWQTDVTLRRVELLLNRWRSCVVCTCVSSMTTRLRLPRRATRMRPVPLALRRVMSMESSTPSHVKTDRRLPHESAVSTACGCLLLIARELLLTRCFILFYFIVLQRLPPARLLCEIKLHPPQTRK